MKLAVPETWETQVSLKGNNAKTWEDLIGSVQVFTWMQDGDLWLACWQIKTSQMALPADFFFLSSFLPLQPGPITNEKN